MLAPKRILHRKVQRGSMKGQAKGNTSGLDLTVGDPMGLESLDTKLAEMQLGITLGLGSGKGNPEEWVAVVKPGRIMFEVKGVPEEVARAAQRS